MINVMTQGGASGSPVFAPDRPAVIGMLYAGLNDLATTPGLSQPYRVPTNQSYVVPAHFIENILPRMKERLTLPADILTLEEVIARAKWEVLQPRGEFGVEQTPPKTTEVRSVTPADIKPTDAQ